MTQPNLSERPTTIAAAIAAFLQMKAEARSRATAKAYRQGLQLFQEILLENGLDLDLPPEKIPLEAFAWTAQHLKAYAAATERLYISAVAGFYEYLLAEELAPVNPYRLKTLRQNRVRPAPHRFPQFPKDDIEKVIIYAKNLASKPVNNAAERLRNLRDRALIICLADSGLRIHEACRLRRGDIDWREGRAILIGKGDRQAVVRFTRRSLAALSDYLNARIPLDSVAGKPLRALPLFLRHDLPPDARSKTHQFKPLTTQSGRDIITRRVTEALGPGAAGSITPHSFRHYFVTVILNATGNLKTAQKLARHSSLTTTSRYAHLSDSELDKAYWQALEEYEP